MAIVNASAYSYGASNFGHNAFGVDVLPIVASTSASVTSSGVRVVFGSATVSASSGFDAIGGFTAAGSSNIAASASISAIATRVRTAEGVVAAVSTNASNATATYVSGATVSSTAVTATLAEEFILKESSMYSYGTAPFGNYAFGEDDLQTVSLPTATVSASGSRVQSAAATISASASVTSAATKVLQSSGAMSSAATNTANAVYIVVAQAVISAQSSINISYIRKRNTGALFVFESSSASLAREKWESEAITAASWSSIPANDVTWIKLAA